jgi:ribosomal protein S12 methylthiotransferase
MKRPANEAKVLERIRNWRAIAPISRSARSFVVGFPGETEADFEYLLEWLDEAQLDRVGAFKFEPVAGAAANDLPDPVPEEVKEERYARFMEKSAAISAAKLAAKIGRTLDVIIDVVEPTRTAASAPPAAARPTRRRSTAKSICATPRLTSQGRATSCLSEIEDADEHDLFGVPAA